MTGGTRKLLAGWVVVAGAGLVAAQPPAPKPTPDAVAAADPLGGMLADARGAYAKLRDYTCTFTRQERVNGTVGAEQVGEMKVRVQPAAVHVRFARPEAVAGQELVYTAARTDGKVRWRPAGAKGVNGFISITADDPKVMADSRRPVTQYGIGPVLDTVAGIAAREKVLGNPVEVFTADFQFAGRNVTRYEIFTRRPHAHRYAYRTVVFVDKETKLPLRIEASDAPKPGVPVGELIEAQSYTDVKFNVGLGNSTFDV